MLEWMKAVLSAPEFSVAVLPAAFLLGLFGSASSCCTPAVLGVLAGYSGSNESGKRRATMLIGVFFLIGTVLAVTALGAVAGFVSQFAGSTMGWYWQIFAGSIAVIFGLVVLDLVPFKLPSLRITENPNVKGPIGASLFGLAVGGMSATCVISCNPLIALPLGAAVLQGTMGWGAVILASFAIGYSLPFAAILVGLSAGFGKLKDLSQRAAPAIRTVSGVILVVAGFYLLATI